MAVLDGDDRLAPGFLERVAPQLADPDVVAAPAWLRLHGVASGTARPAGGRLVDFLHRNACPGSGVVLRRADATLPLGDPTYGDGGMAAHVRVATARAAR